MTTLFKSFLAERKSNVNVFLKLEKMGNKKCPN
jgi:hypothetical protein